MSQELCARTRTGADEAVRTAAPPKVAIAHDYLTQRGGAERVVLAMARAFPEATIHTLLYDAEGTFPEFRDMRIETSPLDRVGALRRHHRAALPLLPWASGRMHIDADVVLASSSGWSHGFDITGRTVVYCHNPARWLYQADDYLGEAGRFSPLRLGLGAMTPGLRRWDRRRAERADQYIANSRVVQGRIESSYGREAEIIPPPFGVDADGPEQVMPELADWAERGWHLVVSRLMPYKHIDRVLEAFRGLPHERVVVVGAGPERERLQAMAPANARLVQNLSDAELRWVYARSQALVAASHEDFGLTPLEANAHGKPVAALRGGGYLDTVQEGLSGVFFDEATPEAIRDAVLDIKTGGFNSSTIRQHAAHFSEDAFARRLRRAVGIPAERSTATSAPAALRTPERAVADRDAELIAS